MQITFKLYASLGDFLPAAQRRGNEMTLTLPEGQTILQVIEPFNLPMNLVHLVLVNGHYIPPEQRGTRALMEGDVLAIWPPVAGG